MVAITVILAAVIGTFVLNLGGSVSQTTPQASFGFDFDDGATNDNVTITHETGDTIEAGRLSLAASKAVDVMEMTPTNQPVRVGPKSKQGVILKLESIIITTSA